MDVWEEYNSELRWDRDLLLRSRRDCEEENSKAQSTDLIRTSQTTPNNITGQVTRLNTKETWPATTSRGEPVATSIVNVSWFCERMVSRRSSTSLTNERMSLSTAFRVSWPMPHSAR